MRKYRVIMDGREIFIDIKEEYVEGINDFLDKLFAESKLFGFKMTSVELLDEEE